MLWNALLSGEIDAYPEYTGTLLQEILVGENLQTGVQLKQALAARGLRMIRPLGFNNTYAIGMKDKLAEQLGLRKISDLRNHPKLMLGFGNEFMDRADGWPGLQQRYQLPHRNVRGLEHDLAYRGIESGTLHVTDLYATDAEIAHYNLRALEDDLNYFPVYDAVILYRTNLVQRAPEQMLRSIARTEPTRPLHVEKLSMQRLTVEPLRVFDPDAHVWIGIYFKDGASWWEVSEAERVKRRKRGDRGEGRHSDGWINSSAQLVVREFDEFVRYTSADLLLAASLFFCHRLDLLCLADWPIRMTRCRSSCIRTAR